MNVHIFKRETEKITPGHVSDGPVLECLFRAGVVERWVEISCQRWQIPLHVGYGEAYAGEQSVAHELTLYFASVKLHGI